MNSKKCALKMCRLGSHHAKSTIVVFTSRHHHCLGFGKEERSQINFKRLRLLFSKNYSLISGMEVAGRDENRTKRSPFTVFVEGNIGSGKTTFLNQFTEYDALVVSEPMELWRNVRGHNVLKLMYENPGRWAFTFQSLVQKTMLDLHLKPTNRVIKLLERSIFSARYCFVENLYREGLMSAPEYAVLDEWFKWITGNLEISGDLMVYLRTEPEVAYKRIVARGRSEESGLSLDYLRRLHDLHDAWLLKRTAFSCPVPVVVLDANKSIAEVVKEFKLTEPDVVERLNTDNRRKGKQKKNEDEEGEEEAGGRQHPPPTAPASEVVA